MRLRMVGLALVLAVLALSACGGGGESARTVTVTVTDTAGQVDTAAPVEPTVNLAGLDGYPREIPMGRVPAVMRSEVGSAGARKDVAVLVAPGIYASRGSGDLGEITDYTTVYGLCVDVNQFQERTGLVLGSTCW